MSGFEEEVRAATTEIISRHPEVGHLQVFNALQSISQDMMDVLRDKETMEKMSAYRKSKP